jgi:uncharacterized protein DUF6744
VTNRHGLTVISDVNVATAGIVTYWNIATTKLPALISALKQTGLRIKPPSRPTNAATLHRAILSLCSETKLASGELFCRSSKNSTFMIVHQVGSELMRLLQVSFVINDHGAQVPKVEIFSDTTMTTGVTHMAWKISDYYSRELELLPAADLGDWLISTIKEHPFNAVPLRDNGGVYFVPNSARETWELLIDTIHAVNPACVFHELPAVRSEDAAFAVTEALSIQIKQTVNGIRSELESGDLKTRALATRAEESKALLLRIRVYEQSLGVQLDDLVQLCHGLEISVATATLAAEAQESSR